MAPLRSSIWGTFNTDIILQQHRYNDNGNEIILFENRKNIKILEIVNIILYYVNNVSNRYTCVPRRSY